MSITFDNNEAHLAPNVYISNFELCSWQNTSDNQVYFSDEEVMNWPVFDYQNFTRIKYVAICVCIIVLTCMH